ncbi:MAG TPA: hypothetical protein VNZ52_09745 [Candidatus Thermoplasmatota archaeon]|nr:hypothetical protein [Candidatus Thermoplasmatota archaeon]
MVETRPPPDPRRLESALQEFVASLNTSGVTPARFEEVFMRRRTPWTIYLPVEYAGTQWHPENGGIGGGPLHWVLKHPEHASPFARLWATTPVGGWRFQILQPA